MSGFEYYEFQAIDRPLTKKEVSKISGLSSRSRVNKRSEISCMIICRTTKGFQMKK